MIPFNTYSKRVGHTADPFWYTMQFATCLDATAQFQRASFNTKTT